MRLRKFAVTLIAIVALLVAALFLLPWQGWVQQKLIAMLVAKGFASPALTIDHIGLRGLVLKDVTLGDPAVKLATLTIGYNLRAVINGQINDVEINGLDLRAVQTEKGWQLQGMEALLNGKASGKPIVLPVTLAQLRQLPLHSVTINDAQVTIVGKGWQAQLPINAKLQHGSDATIHLESKDARIVMGADSVTLGTIIIDLTLDDAKKQWPGKWTMTDAVTTSETLSVPTLQAAGELVIGSDTIDTTATLKSADASHSAAFTAHIALNKPEASLATLTRASMPLSGGTISVNNVRVPLNSSKPIALKLEVKKIAIDGVMDGLTGSKASATGAVSGTIPVTITRAGGFRVGNSALSADGPGTIMLAPDAIPGDNPQVALVRDVLKNLHYTVLALGLDMSPDGQLKAVLVVEGSNPEVEKGRAIKLKVQLSGDLLGLLTQNLKLMTDPKTFIRQNAL